MLNIVRAKYLLDATDQVAGRLATKVAILLMGKNVASYRPNYDHGATVEITNVSKLKFTGKKMIDNVTRTFSGYPGGLKTTPLAKSFENDPCKVFKRIISNMLPKNKLRPKMLKRLHLNK
ncbi:MAG: 50S ribosomal protein L13 [Patescibacteria group bacterium]|jgi:large subunit ribosomal protein L13